MSAINICVIGDEDFFDEEYLFDKLEKLTWNLEINKCGFVFVPRFGEVPYLADKWIRNQKVARLMPGTIYHCWLLKPGERKKPVDQQFKKCWKEVVELSDALVVFFSNKGGGEAQKR